MDDHDDAGKPPESKTEGGPIGFPNLQLVNRINDCLTSVAEISSSLERKVKELLGNDPESDDTEGSR